MSSGSEDVGAATSAPVLADVMALMATSDVSTSSRYGPSYSQRSLHSRHHASVRASAESASSTGGVSSYDRCQVSTSRSRAPSTATNSVRTSPLSTSSGSAAVSRKASGPAVATIPSGAGSTHGTIDA